MVIRIGYFIIRRVANEKNPFDAGGCFHIRVVFFGASARSGLYFCRQGSTGTDTGQFDGPYGTAADSSGNIYVTDWNNHRVQKFHPWICANSVELSDGWHWLSWFGYFNVNTYPWTFHMEHGWLYPFGTDTSNVWFWDVAMNAYWWTSETTYPHVYRSEPPGGTWLFYDSGATPSRPFLNYSTGGWEAW